MKHSIHRRCRTEDELVMTPMIDVTFLLLIFFMCTLKFKTLEGQLAAYLPRDRGSDVHSTPLEDVTVRLDVITPGRRLQAHSRLPYRGVGSFVFDDERVVRYTVGPRSTTDPRACSERLARLFAADPTRPLTIDAGPGIVYGEVVRVIDAGIATGFRKISFTGLH